MVSLRPRARGGSLLLAARRRRFRLGLGLGRRSLRLALSARLEPDRRAGALLGLMLGTLRTNRDRHVREPLALERGAACRARVWPLGEPAPGAAVDGDPGDVEPVGAHVVVVLGVGDRGAQQLLERF